MIGIRALAGTTRGFARISLVVYLIGIRALAGTGWLAWSRTFLVYLIGIRALAGTASGTDHQVDLVYLIGIRALAGTDAAFSRAPLDLTKRELRNLLLGEELRKARREARAAQERAKDVELLQHMSHKLRFSLALPKGWSVMTDTLEPHPIAQEFLSWLRARKDDALHGETARRKRSKTIPLEKFQRARQRYQERVNEAQRNVVLERMVTGLFQAFGPHETVGAEVEVSRLRLTSTMSPLDVYTQHKSRPEVVPFGGRPPKGMIIDGIQAVTYYYTYDTGDGQAEWIEFFNNYVVDGLDGWIISCSCIYGDPRSRNFIQYKPLFQRIARSFHRIHAV